MTADQLIEKLINTGGAIISSDSCHPAEIAIARSCGGFATHGDFGLVLKPARWVKAAQAVHEEKMDAMSANVAFRTLLHKNGVSGHINYEWNNGDPLYMGDPISGRANKFERAAIAEMAKA